MTDQQVFVDRLNSGDIEGALQAARRLVKGGAALGASWMAVARFAQMQGDVSLATAAADRLVEALPAEPEHRLARAALLAENGRIEEAAASISPLAERNPNEPRFRHFLGTVAMQMGDAEAARHHFLAALSRWPTSGQSWLEMASLVRFAAGDPLLARLEDAAAASAGTTPDNRAALAYALSKGHADLGQHDRAFAEARCGAELVLAQRGDDAALDVAALNGLNAPPPPPAAFQPEVSRSIFVLGLPRSGTSLVEQMLASHSQVSGGGETNLFATALRRGGAPGVGSCYHHLLNERFGGAGRIVDKGLSNTSLAGEIARALPDAPIIWLRRDPLDVAWSCYRTLFSRGLGWSFSLEAMGRHFAIEDRIFVHWREVLGPRILEVPYAALVTAADAWIPRILAHAGLPFEPQVFDFHRTRRAVTTASVNQVRQPLYQSAIGSAEPYRQHLQPFLRAYEAAQEGA